MNKALSTQLEDPKFFDNYLAPVGLIGGDNILYHTLKNHCKEHVSVI